MATGIRKRHSTCCASHEDGRCRCAGRWEAWVYLAREGKRIHRSFATESEAKSWRADATTAAAAGKLRAPVKRTIREAADAWHEGAVVGRIRDRSGRPYKPSTLRGYRRSLDQRVLPDFGALQLSELRRGDVQAWVDRMLGEGLSPGTIRNALNPLQAVYRHAIRRDLVSINPTRDLELPTARGRRDRIASAVEADALLAALAKAERATWATAFYAGLRRGELRALRWSDVDFGRSEIRVERSWDQHEGPLDPKSESGSRTVPLLAALRDHMLDHKLTTDRAGEDLCFGRSAVDAFVGSTVNNRAKQSWKVAELRPITLHECRHTFASLLIDAGVNAKAIQTFMGHSTIEMTFNQYGHLMPGSRNQARELVDAYLEAAIAEGRAEAKVAEPRHSLATVEHPSERFPAVPANASGVEVPHI